MGMFLRRGPAPSRGTPIGSLDVGATVKLNVNGIAREFLVVHQGLPSSLYDASCDGTWLLMKDIYENRQWNSSNVNVYETSTINTYLNSDFVAKFDSDIQPAIKQVKIPYRKGGGSGGTDQSGANGLSCKVFLLSGYEVGWTQSTNNFFPIDGACLSYFGGTATEDSKRISYLNGSVNSWWTRSQRSNYANYLWVVNTAGGNSRLGASGSSGIRPAFILPSDFLLTDDMLA